MNGKSLSNVSGLRAQNSLLGRPAEGRRREPHEGGGGSHMWEKEGATCGRGGSHMREGREPHEGGGGSHMREEEGAT